MTLRLLLFCLIAVDAEAFSTTSSSGNTVGEESTRHSSSHRQVTFHHEEQHAATQSQRTRRNFLQIQSAIVAAATSIAAYPATAFAAAAATTLTTVAEANPVVTDRIFFKVRISRQDGTFYVRDDLPDTPENRVFYGQLTLELFGKTAPQTVAKFKSYLPVDAVNVLDDNPLPFYSRATFPSLDPASGVLVGGKIPGLELTEVNGYSALRYGGRLLPASLWIESSSSTKSSDGTAAVPAQKLSHVGKGLLTHAILEPMPVFGITTRTDTTQLDSSNTVFGRLVLDEDAQAFVAAVSSIPTYSVDSRPPSGETPVDDAAQAVFSAQRAFFRSTAKAFGDTRLDKVYQGKLLRRVEVTQVGFL